MFRHAEVRSIQVSRTLDPSQAQDDRKTQKDANQDGVL